MKKWKKYTAIAVTGGLLSFGVAFGVAQVCSYASTQLQNTVATAEENTAESSETADALETPDAPGGNFSQNNMSPQGMGGMGQQMNSNVELADSPGEIVLGTTTNSAASLTVDKTNATTIVMSSSNNEVKIDEAGTYIITGSCSDGNITVKKGTEGVVLILKDLTLTSTTGAPLSINKETEVKLVVEGTVTLTDGEDPADETSTDTTVADAFDGAAIKIKDGAVCYLTGTGTLNLNGSSCKNGIKTGDEEGTILVIDGSLTLNISAANDAINAGYDLAILDGTLTINAGDDAIHAERIVTIGEDGNGPTINIESSYEGIEGTVVNLFGGTVSVVSSDDGINAGSSDYDLTPSINITGGTYDIKAGYDGIDSNGNINIIGGSITINSANNGGDAGIDYDGTCYISDDADLNNNSGISGPDGGAMGGGPGMGGMQSGMQQGGMQNGQNDMQGGMGGQRMQGGPGGNLNGNPPTAR